MTDKRTREAFTRTIQEAADESEPRKEDGFWRGYHHTLNAIIKHLDSGAHPWAAITFADANTAPASTVQSAPNGGVPPTWHGATAAVHFARGALHAHGGDQEREEGGGQK